MCQELSVSTDIILISKGIVAQWAKLTQVNNFSPSTQGVFSLLTNFISADLDEIK